MAIALLRLVVVPLFIVLVTSQQQASQQQQLPNENRNGAASPYRACGFELIWPPFDGIVLVATDSLSTTIYFKSWGNCSEFLHKKSNQPRFQVDVVLYDIRVGRDSPLQKFERIDASPLNDDITPVQYRLERSPLLSKQQNLVYDSSGLDATKEFSVWCFSLVYPDYMLNTFRLDDLDDTSNVLELHLRSDITQPVVDVPKPSTAINFRLLGQPSSHFHQISPRYNSIPGYVCMSACGSACIQHSESSRNVGVHSLLTSESPVCTRNSKALHWNLTGPSFLMQQNDGANVLPPLPATVQPSECSDDHMCPNRIIMVSIGGSGGRGGERIVEEVFASKGSEHTEIFVTGAGRHRLLSVIASVLHDSSVGFVLLKTWRARVDLARVMSIIQKFDLVSSYAVAAFHKKGLGAEATHVRGSQSAKHWLPLPGDDFGSVDDGILLSRAAAVVILQAASAEAGLRYNETLPAACSEHLIFSDAWLCWCAAELNIPAIEVRFAAEADSGQNLRNCTASSSLYRKLQQLYEQQRLSTFRPVMPPFTEMTTLGFQYFMQTLVFHVVSGPRILNILDDEDAGDSFFWDVCCSRLLIGHMMSPHSVPSHAGLHPLLHYKWDELASANNRSAFVAVLRAAVVSDAAENGSGIVNSSLTAVRRILRLSAAATRVLGCSAFDNDMLPPAHAELLHGKKTAAVEGDIEPFQMHVITPAVLLTKHGKPVNRRLFLATHEEWSSVFGYNPLFSKDASRAFAAPQFSSQDWHFVCMLNVMTMQGKVFNDFEENSREYFACSAFAHAMSQRTYAAGMTRCFDLPPRSAGSMLYAASFQAHLEYFKRCTLQDDRGVSIDDDPWMLRQLAKSIQKLLLERWVSQQSWFEASLHLHSRLILRADEYAETLQWNICRGTVASVTAVVEHDVPIGKYIWSLGAPVHDPQLKLHLEVIPGIYQYDTGFHLAGQRFHGQIVSLMAADMMLGDERRWHRLSSVGTAEFFNSSSPRMLVLSRLELDGSNSCCALNITYACHDMVVFRSPLHANVRLDLFNYQQNIWQGENYAVGLLRSGGYELYNPCLVLPVFHNHKSDMRPNQNENSILQLRSKHYFCSACMPQEDLDLEKHCAENNGYDRGACSR